MKNNLKLYSLSQSISNIGNQLRWLAWPLLVFQVTGNAYYLAIAGLGDELGAIAGSFVSSHFANKYNRKHLLITMDIILAATTFAIGLLTQSTILLIVPIFFAFSFCGEIYSISSAIIIDDIKTDENVRTSYAKIQSAIFFTASITVLLGGLWILNVGLRSIFIIDAISYVLCATIVGFIKAPPQIIKKDLSQDYKEKFKEIIDGYKTTLKEDRYILAIILLSGLITLGANIVYQVNIAYLKNIYLVSDGYMSFWRFSINVGAFVGSMLLLSKYFKNINNYKLISRGYILLGILYAILPMMTSAVYFLVLYCILIGIGELCSIASRSETIKWVNDKNDRGRILAFRGTLLNIMMLLAVLVNNINLRISNGVFGFILVTILSIIGVGYVIRRKKLLEHKRKE